MMSPNGVATIRDHIRWFKYKGGFWQQLDVCRMFVCLCKGSRQKNQLLKPWIIHLIPNRKNNLNIDVHDGISPEPPKVSTCPAKTLFVVSFSTCPLFQGLHFLSERSQHRVEGSDRAAQADLESLLIELNLLWMSQILDQGTIPNFFFRRLPYQGQMGEVMIACIIKRQLLTMFLK